MIRSVKLETGKLHGNGSATKSAKSDSVPVTYQIEQ